MYCVGIVPAGRPAVIASGVIYSLLTSHTLSVPALSHVYDRYKQFSGSIKHAIESQETAPFTLSLTSTLVSSITQSFAVVTLLELAGAETAREAAILGSLLLAVDTGSQIIGAYFVENKPIDVIATRAVVGALNTVGLSVVLLWSSTVH